MDEDTTRKGKKTATAERGLVADYFKEKREF